MNCLPLFNLPLRIRPKSISQEPKPRSINSGPGRLGKTCKHRSGRPSRHRVPKHRACKKPGHCPYQSLDRSKPLGHISEGVLFRKMSELISLRERAQQAELAARVYGGTVMRRARTQGKGKQPPGTSEVGEP